MRLRLAVMLVVLAWSANAHAQTAPQGKTPFEQALLAARTPLVLQNGKFSGAGAAILDKAVEESRFVLVGEDHLSREIPRFTEALCEEMHPDAYAVEVGPYATKFVDGLLHDPKRLAKMTARDAQYPNNMAFLDMRDENDLAAHCAASSRNPHFALWGLDQEFLGSAGALLHDMAATLPGPQSRAAIAEAQKEERAAEAHARQTGDFSDLFLMASTDAEVQALQTAVGADGNFATRDLLHEFTLSREIYRLNKQGSPDSNLVRAELLKQHFLRDSLPFKQRNPSPHILFKLGDNHTIKGFNYTHELNLGDFIVELADGEQAKSLHLWVFGAHGMHYKVAGYSKPLGQEPFNLASDPEYKFLSIAVSDLLPQNGNANETTLTLFDLRKLRYQHLNLSPEWEHAIYGQDILILFPQLTVDSAIDPHGGP